jgi:hypothetical protein
VLISMLLTAGALASLSYLSAHNSPVRWLSLGVLAFELASLLVWGWAVIGTTMSALKGLFSGSILWSVLAILFLASGVFSILRSLATEMRPFIAEHWAVVQGEQPGDQVIVTYDASHQRAVLTGGIQEGAAASLERLLRSEPAILELQLDSPGGWLREGERLAEIVSRYNLKTYTNGTCMSSCTLPFLAGIQRTAGPSARIGFHQSRGIGESGPKGTDHTLIAIYKKAGLNDEFIRRIDATPSSSIWVPTRAELLAGHVLTR